MIIAMVTFLMVLCALFAALLFRTTATTVRALNESHERTTRYTKDLLDRLMAMDFNTYKAYEHLESIREDTMETAPEEPMVPTLGPDRGGFGSRLGLRALSVRATQEDTEALLEADIPS